VCWEARTEVDVGATAVFAFALVLATTAALFVEPIVVCALGSAVAVAVAGDATITAGVVVVTPTGSACDGSFVTEPHAASSTSAQETRLAPGERTRRFWTNMTGFLRVRTPHPRGVCAYP
jgi:hypothetical protein